MNYLHDYSMFESVEELNESINDHIKRNQYELNDTDRDVFMTLARYSVKYKGVAHLKVATIADIVVKSSITIRRALNRLSALGMIEKVEFMREISGGNGANIYRIMPADDRAEMIGREEAEESTQASDEEGESSNESINSLSNSRHTYDPIDKETVIHESIVNNTPREIVAMLAPFFYGSKLYKYVGIIFKAKYRPHIRIRIEDHIDDFRACIFDVIRRFKAGYIRNLDGYLYASIKRLSRRLYLHCD